MSRAPEGVAIVTGASSGIGLATARRLARGGYRVFGTSRKPGVDAAGVAMLICDVTDEASVQALVAEVVRQAGRIDLVVNNAGLGLLGGIEETSIEQARRLFDVNVFGTARVVKAVLPIMRAQRSGRIVNMSSVLGLIPSPFNGYYAATKHAVEGYTETLDHEVREFGLRAVLVEPGYTKTAFEENLTRADEPLAAYQTSRSRSEALMRQGIAAGDPAEVVAETVLKAASAAKPKLRYSAGKQSGQVRSLRRFMPEGVVDKILRKVNGFPA